MMKKLISVLTILGCLLSFFTIGAFADNNNRLEMLPVGKAPERFVYAGSLFSSPTADSTFTPISALSSEPTVEDAAVPEPEPTPYHLPDEDYILEEINKLGLVNDKKEYVAYKIGCLVFEKDGIQKYLPVFLPDKKDKIIVLCDAFSNTELIKFTSNTPGYRGFVSGADLYYAQNLRGFETLNDYFEGTTNVTINRLQCPFYYEYDPDRINFDEYADDMKFDRSEGWYYDSADYSYTREEIARMYVKYTPGLNRVTIYDLFPELNDAK